MIYLHIGRNKAGSTTLQDFCLRNLDALAQRGTHYALYSHLVGSVPGVLGFRHQLDLKDYAFAHPDVNFVVSHEWMFNFDEFHTGSVAEALRGLPVKVIAYIRPYDSWVCSSYAQDIRSGESRDDFDGYFEWLRPRFAVWPCLQRWGERLGFDNMIVRLIDRQNTPWNRITEDFLGAIGLEPGLGEPVPASNLGTHWAVTELLRAMADKGIGPGQMQALPDLLRKCLDANSQSGRDIQYLTPTQRRELAEIYADDIAKINTHTDARLNPEPLAELPERPFLPSLQHLPSNTLRDFSARAGGRDFASAHPQAAAVARQLGLIRKPFSAKIAAAIRRFRGGG